MTGFVCDFFNISGGGGVHGPGVSFFHQPPRCSFGTTRRFRISPASHVDLTQTFSRRGFPSLPCLRRCVKYLTNVQSPKEKGRELQISQFDAIFSTCHSCNTSKTPPQIQRCGRDQPTQIVGVSTAAFRRARDPKPRKISWNIANGW